MAITTIESLDSKPNEEIRATLAEADIIIGVDNDTQREFTVYGLPPLESTVTLRKPSAMRLVRVCLDSPSTLERLAAMVREVKKTR